MGLTPARGEWRHRLLTSNSTATFAAGSLVALNPRRLLVEYTSVTSSYVGIAQSNSVDSLPAGKILVAVPSGGPEITMYANTGTLALSSLSIGQAVGIKKSGNTVDQVDQTVTSVASLVGIIYAAPVDMSSVTRVEIAISPVNSVWFSNSSNTYLT